MVMDMDDPDDGVEEIQRQGFTELELKPDHADRPLWVCGWPDHFGNLLGFIQAGVRLSRCHSGAREQVQ